MLTLKLEQDLDFITTECGDFTDMNDGETYDKHHGHPMDTEAIAAPAPANHWPPGIKEYVRRVAIATATSIVDAIYTQEELDKSVDNILLDNDTQ